MEQHNSRIDLLRKRLNLFKLNNVTVHVVMKDTKIFYNGKIEKIDDDSFIIYDRKAGRIPILYQEVHKVEPYVIRD